MGIVENTLIGLTITLAVVDGLLDIVYKSKTIELTARPSHEDHENGRITNAPADETTTVGTRTSSVLVRNGINNATGRNDLFLMRAVRFLRYETTTDTTETCRSNGRTKDF